jgi:hypothetical protein
VVVTPSGTPPGTDLPALGVKYRERERAAIAIRDSALDALWVARGSDKSLH